ncbi:DUF2798 domain-containing protein [Pontibacter sp. FD36]|uniref:DUF2798 domain-containing protein n=1 Tax=Pontibacter sp. FD36 TaxID=2789860 RepID=UPI0018AC67D7|nr:DUF2798 domain-containing protein [Pontibacter sp. FD36]MBF8964812.1 DUF2798 domain-containing protein [Pontibacter sp. FD36]
MKKNLMNPALKRKLLVISLLCLLVASALQLYTFGFADNFFSNWLRMFVVLFVLVAGTVLAVVPGANYVVNKTSQLFR